MVMVCPLCDSYDSFEYVGENYGYMIKNTKKCQSCGVVLETYDCGRCQGTGKEVVEDLQGNRGYMACPKCGGSGEIEELDRSDVDW